MKSALYLILLLGSIPLCNGAAPPDGAPALPVSFRESLPVADTAFQVMKTPFRQWSGPTPSEEDDVRDEGNPLGDEIEQVQKARKTIAALKKAGKFLEKLTMGDLVTLPVGIQQEIGNITYTLGIESIRFYPEYTEADLFLEVDLPGESLDPVFGATGITGSLYSPFVVSLSMLLLAESLNSWQYFGMLLVLAGVVLVGYRKKTLTIEHPPIRGFVYAALAVFFTALGIVIIKPVSTELPFFWIILIRSFGGMIAMVLYGLAIRQPLTVSHILEAKGGMWLILGTFLGQYVSMMIWVAGYKYTSASVASILNETASVFILLLSWIFLKEHLNFRKVIGVLITITGVLFVLQISL